MCMSLISVEIHVCGAHTHKFAPLQSPLRKRFKLPSPNDYPKVQEAKNLGRRLVTAGKLDDEEALYAEIAAHIHDTRLVEYTLLYLAMLVGGIMNQLMNDDEWSNFLMEEEI